MLIYQNGCAQNVGTSASEPVTTTVFVAAVDEDVVVAHQPASDLASYATTNSVGMLRSNNSRGSRRICYCPLFILFLFSIAFVGIEFAGVNATLLSSENEQPNGAVGEQQQPMVQWEHEPTAYQHHQQPHEEQNGFNTTYISQILNRLTDSRKYDKRLRPRYGEGAVDVGITIHVTSISAVSEVDMDITLDFYLRQTWYDPRLAFQQLDPELARRIKKLTVGVDYLERLWKPDTFFPNEKTAVFHLATTHNSFLRIEPDGRIYTSQRLTVKAMCQMELQLFPMDSQTCKLGLESYGYDVADIDYYWGERRSDGRRPEDAVAFDVFFLPQFRRTGYRVTGTHITTASGTYARLYFEVIVSRNIGFYLMNIVIPSMLIVAISWVSFWLSREASPARVGLGVTTVLTMTTLITTTNNTMPKVSYIKGLDVFLNFCFIMVFAALVEYAIVIAIKLQKILRDRRERTRSAPAMRAAGAHRGDSAMPSTGAEFPMFMSYPTTPAGGLAVPSPNTQSYVYRAPGLLVPAATSTTTGAYGRNPYRLDYSFNLSRLKLYSDSAPSGNIASGGTQMPAGSGTTTAISIPPECDCRLGNIPLVQYAASDFQQQQNSAVPYMMAATGAKLGRRHRRRPYSYYGGMSGGGASPFLASSTGGGHRSWLCRTLHCRRLKSAMTIMSQRELEKVDFVPFTS
ncbi:Neurotransmitter-gated ion-channel transmembrane region [Globodera pallida]|nr:Neurotransmitter-gated ion-channel transmembrane region [Globodera pallida]